jgi:hypothetical protein
MRSITRTSLNERLDVPILMIDSFDWISLSIPVSLQNERRPCMRQQNNHLPQAQSSSHLAWTGLLLSPLYLLCRTGWLPILSLLCLNSVYTSISLSILTNELDTISVVSVVQSWWFDCACNASDERTLPFIAWSRPIRRRHEMENSWRFWEPTIPLPIGRA